ncbi:FAD-dependent oxidoreductase [Lachnotalea glycerini]|uniref:NADH oxidase n=1 Tax=Lachnotalea glycerini TaxID=1763509 RepID=A0A371JI18_9FIRM|nr:FAD-dependent oxidoreductase [Lachnotalea glycerini]RDY32385.1 NADH oxidase [Lachnotalea glycerini]
MRFQNMFTPVQIGPVTIKNRFVVPPMGNNFANGDGCLSERSLGYYAARAKGGFGLITVEATVVDKTAKGGPKKPCLYDDTVIDSFAKVADAVHAEGGKISVQLQHAGAEGNAKAAGHPIKAPSPIASHVGKDIPQEITREEIYDLIEKYGDSALRAKKAGFDFVEVHMAHGYLVSSFISQRTNKRVDEFGGNFENRMRLSRLIIENIRKKVGESLGIICRINCDDNVLGGISVQDAAAVAAYLEVCKADALHVSRAVHIRDEFMWAPTCVHGGFNADYVTEIKKAVQIPVIMVGRFTEPDYAELMVKEGRADLIAFGRQSIADPEMPNKSYHGELDSMTPCIGCLQGCVANMFQGKPIQCLVNPRVGHETELTKAETKKQIMVIGGGVGGLYAAYITRLKGHNVTVYEKSGVLGGNMRLAAFPPGKGDLIGMVRNYIALCEKSGVKIVMNTEVTEALIRKECPDAVIVATGSKPLVLPIPGIQEAGLLHGDDVLSGKAQCGLKVLVVGGGMVGCELAAFLGEANHEVTVIELRDKVGADVITEHRKYLMKDFDEYKIQTVTGAKVSEFNTDGVTYTLEDGTKKQLSGFDNVVLAMGYRNYNPFEEEASNLAKEVYVIGDAIRARRALDATREAYEAALNI